MEQRDDAVHHVARAERGVGRMRLLEVGEQAGVREHRRPRRAGGTAREHQHGEVVGIDLDALYRIGVEQLGVDSGRVDRRVADGDHHAERRHGGTVDVGPRRRRRIDDRRRGGHHTQLVGELGTRARRVEWNRHRTDAEHGKVRDDERQPVAAHERHSVPGAQSQRPQPATRVGHLGLELGVGGAGVGGDDRHVRPVVPAHDVSQIHRTPVPRRTCCPPSCTADCTGRCAAPVRSGPDALVRSG